MWGVISIEVSYFFFRFLFSPCLAKRVDINLPTITDSSFVKNISCYLGSGQFNNDLGGAVKHLILVEPT